MALEQERLEVARRVHAELGQVNALSPNQARLFVRCLQNFWQVPLNQWSERESRNQLADARRLLHAAEVLGDLGQENPAASIECYRRAGEIYEWLARSNDGLRTETPVALFAAGAYQLGELPAMAASVLRQAVVTGQLGDLDFDQVPNQPHAETDAPQAEAIADDEPPGEPPLGADGMLWSAFFQADFDKTLALAADFWLRHPELTGRAGSKDILSEDAEDRVGWYLVVELVRAIGLASDALRRGDSPRMEVALNKLKGLEALALRSSAEDVWTLVHLLQASADRFARASLYSKVAALAGNDPAAVQRLRAFARGQFARGRGVLWTSQIHGLDRLAAASSFALCTPTGSGKTLVANLALIKELLIAEHDLLAPAPLALYLVPSRALASEVEAKLTDELGRDLIVTGLYGGADWGITDVWLTADRPTVLIATVEKAEALMRHLGPLLTGRLKLLILDEAHQVVAETDTRALVSLIDHGSRAMRLESLVARLLALKPDVIRIALTAVAGGAAAPVARWMEGRTDAVAVGVNYRSTRQLVGVLEATPGQTGRLQLDLMNGIPLYVRGRDDAVYLPLRIPVMPQLNAQARGSLAHYNQLHILWTALQLRIGGRRILISVAEKPEQTMRWFAEQLAKPDWVELARFTAPTDPDLLRRYGATLEACQDYCGANSYELTLLRLGIATNHGQMPQRLRRLMTDLIDRRVCEITVATATLTEGVNLPFDIIFLTALKRSGFDKDNNAPVITPLATSEFRNLSGRAGRPGAAEGVEGLTLIGVPQAPSTTAQGQLANQRRQVATLQAEYEELLNRLAVEAAPDAQVNSPLAVLLQLLAHYLQTHLNVAPGAQTLDWLARTLPIQVTPLAGTSARTAPALLADSLDELDAVLLAAVEELAQVIHRAPAPAEAEAFLRTLWSKTFAQVAAVQEAWMEQAFIHRGQSLLALYPDPNQRKRLYQYGYAPTVGLRFEQLAPAIKAELASAVNYGISPPDVRLTHLKALGQIVREQPGFGFRVRDTVGDAQLLQDWEAVLTWWVQGPNAPAPEPIKLRNWQRFVSDNLDFRLGVAIGAVVAESWSSGTVGAVTPDLATWRQTTGLPWFGFWSRELLRWGTLDPFVAFCMAQGLAPTREAAAARRPQFEAFIRAAIPVLTPDDLIDPQMFLQWQRGLPRLDGAAPPQLNLPALLDATDGRHGRYSVTPVNTEQGVAWFDAAGFQLALSPQQAVPAGGHRDDFDLLLDGGVHVRRTFESHVRS